MSDYQGLRVGDLIPMAPASDGQAWIPAAAVVQLLHNAENDFADDAKGEYHQLIIKQPKNDPHSKIPDGPPGQ